jgi:hypothetical protein
MTGGFVLLAELAFFDKRFYVVFATVIGVFVVAHRCLELIVFFCRLIVVLYQVVVNRCRVSEGGMKRGWRYLSTSHNEWKETGRFRKTRESRRTRWSNRQ